MAKTPIPNFPVRDLKLDFIARLAHEDRDLPDSKNPRPNAEYVRQQSFLPIPTCELGEKILLDGHNVAGLIKPAMASSKSLMIAVDDWI